MSNLPPPSAGCGAPQSAYTARILAALGTADPLLVLREMPRVLREAVGKATVQERAVPEGPGKWSVCQVAQHLADSDLVGAFRFRMILAHDAPGIPGYDQELWVDRLHRGDEDVETALEDFSTLRRANLRLLEGLTPVDLARVGRHSERGDESLGLLIRLYAGHDLTHLRQIERILAAVRNVR